MTGTLTNMSNFNYTQFHLFDKSGIELPISYKSSYSVILKNEHGDNAVFYGLYNTEGNFEEFVKISSGNRFSSNRVPATITIGENTFEQNIEADIQRTSSNIDNEYYITSISNIPFTEEMEEAVSKLVFPSITLNSSLAFNEISVDLIETQSIYILTQKDDIFVKPAENTDISDWRDRYKLLFFIDNRTQENFRFFTVSKNELVWKNKVLVDLNSTDEDGFKVNIGFTASEEGVYEQMLYICLIDTHNESNESSWDMYPIGDISLAAEAIGEDERYRALFANFGIPDPITYNNVFANTSNDEGKTDYIKLNENSKKMFLAYPEIFPYVGTYKALINAVSVLGYDDIFFKEWYKEVGKTIQHTSLVSYDVSYLSDKNAKTIENVSIEERLSLRKLNWLSMVYRINKMLDDVEDKNGFPGIEDVYSFNNTEIVPKLYSLKKWLEKYIIGLHCKIIDITGEGIYFERYRLATYGSYQQIFDWNNEKNLIPKIDINVIDDFDNDIIDENGILYNGTSTIKVDVGLNENSTLEDYKTYRFSDFIDGYFDENRKFNDIVPNEISDDYIFFGKTFECLNDFETYQIKATTSGEDFIFGKDFIEEDSTPIIVSNNEIFFSPIDLLIHEKQTAFTNLPRIQLERANIRKMHTSWLNSTVYKIYPDLRDNTSESYFISDGINTGSFIDYIVLTPPSYSKINISEEAEDSSQGIYTYNSDDDEITITTISGKTIKRTSIVKPEYKQDDEVDTEHYTSYIDNNSILMFTKNIRTYGLRYSAQNEYNMPLFSIVGYEIEGFPELINSSEEYYLEIIDGKMIFDDPDRNRTIYLNFNFDDDKNTQEVEVNIVYDSPEFRITEYGENSENSTSVFFPNSIYENFVNLYLTDPESCIKYNNVYSLDVHNTGKYTIDVFAKDKYNNIFAKNCENYAYVHLREFALDTFTNTPNSGNEFSVNGISISGSLLDEDYVDFCIYKNSYFIKDLKKTISDVVGEESISISYPTYSYSMYTPEQNSYLHFMNIADKYSVLGMNYSYSTTSERAYKGYYLTLSRDTSNFKYKVIDKYDENAVAAQYTKYGYGYVESTNNRISDILYTISKNNEYSYADVNFILYNELGNYPILQTYGTMIHEGSIPYAPNIPEDKKEYTKDNFRLLIGDFTEESYVWASFTDQVKYKLPRVIVSDFISAVQEEYTYEPAEDSSFETFEESTEKVLIDYCDYFIDIFKEYNSSVYDWVDSDDSIDSSYEPYMEESLRTITEKEQDSSDFYCELQIGEDSSYTANMFDDVQAIFVNSNYEFFDEKVKSEIQEDKNIKTSFEDFDNYVRNEIEESLAGVDQESEEYIKTTNVCTSLCDLVELTSEVLDFISDSILKNMKNTHYVDEINENDLFSKVLYSLFIKLHETSSLYNYAITADNSGKLIDNIENVYDFDNINDFKEGVGNIVKNIILDAANDKELASSTHIAYYYTKMLFSYYSYIAGIIYTDMIFFIETNSEELSDVYYNLADTLYTRYMKASYPEATNKILYLCILIAKGLYSYFYEYSDNVYSGLNAVITDTTPHRYEDSPKQVSIYDKLVENIAMFLHKYSVDEKKWVTRYSWKQDSSTGRNHREYYFAVAGRTSEVANLFAEDEIGEDEYSAKQDYIPEIYYIKSSEAMLTEGSIEAGVSVDETDSKNALPDVGELIKCPYISAYIQPTWKALVSITALSDTDGEELFGELDKDEKYLCIEYGDANFKWHFYKGEMIKLVFNSLTNTQYNIQSAYEVVGYDVEKGVVIVKGYINPAYIKEAAHEVWARLAIVDDEGKLSSPVDSSLSNILSSAEQTYLEEFSGTNDIEEKKCKPLSRTYRYTYSTEEDGPVEIEKPYRLPIRRINATVGYDSEGVAIKELQWQYKVLFYDKGIFRPIETYMLAPDEKVRMYVSYAHNAYVDYVMRSDSAKEYPNGTTEVKVEYNNGSRIKMQYVDDTFVLNSKNFNTAEGLYAWMNPTNTDEPTITKNPVYKYSKELSYIPVELDKNTPNIAFSVNIENLGFDKDSEYYVYWKIYRKKDTDNTREFLFESYNKVLYLDTQVPGIYDLEVTVYDYLGNKVTKLFKGAYKIKK